MNRRFVVTMAIYFALGLGYPAALWYLGASGSPQPAQESEASAAKHQQSTGPVFTDKNQPSSKPATSAADSYTYNYYYPAPQSRLAIAGQIAAIVSAILLTVFTCGLWITSVWQWKVSNKTLLLQFRPQIIIRSVVLNAIMEQADPEIVYYLLRNKPVVGEFSVANIGGSPATIISSLCMVHWRQGPLPMRRPYDGRKANNPVTGRIAPHGRVIGSFESDRPFDTQHTNIIPGDREGAHLLSSHRDWRLYVMGWIDYADDLGVIRRSAFCRQLVPQTDDTLAKTAGEQRSAHFVKIDNPDYEHAE